MNLSPDASESGWRRYSIGRATFSLHAIPEHLADMIDISDPPIVRSNTPFKPVFRVRDITSARQELPDAGVRLLDPKSEPNSHRLDLLDPEGNVFQITS